MTEKSIVQRVLPVAPQWPLDSRLHWIRFQHQWAGLIEPPSILLDVYKLVLAAAINEKLKEPERGER